MGDMGTIVAGFAILLLGFVVATWVQITKTDDSPVVPLPEAGIQGGLARLARPLATTSSVRNAARSPLLNQLRERVVASGAYGGSFEAYIAMQIAAMIVGSAVLIVALSGLVSGIFKVVVVILGVFIAGFPYNTATKGASAKADQSAAELPEFVEMLQIPLVSGMSVEQALRFTCRFTDGAVAAEVRWLLDTLAARTMDDAVAFTEAGKRIGTPEAISFFATLGQAHIEGTRVAQTLTRQAESLRSQYHQVRRARVKKLPVTLIVAFAIHFLPFLFALVIVPLIDGLKGV